MVLRRFFTLVVLLALGLAGACSGESSDGRRPSGVSGKGNAGSSGSATSGRGGTVGSGGTAGSLGEGGESGEPTAVGGTAGSGGVGVGGNLPLAGIGGNSGTGLTSGASGSGASGASGAGTGGTGSPPIGWFCSLTGYGDGICDCGCSAFDIDCPDQDIDSCERCNVSGSCEGGSCPGRINPENTSACIAPPSGWTCHSRHYQDGTSCDCGCGIVDPDCDDDTIDDCDTCNLGGACGSGACPTNINPDDISKCYLPEGWACSRFMFGDGNCDCGCGVVDVDCPTNTLESCEFCSFGCAREACPGSIDPEDNSSCIGPPYNWTCQDRFWEDGQICHCGCGAVDPDCDPNELASCDVCNVSGACSIQGCPGTIDPDFIGGCARPDPPNEWTCAEYRYADGYQCDCGCGAFDLDCPTNTLAACDYCPGCSYWANCQETVDPNDITSCIPPPDGWTCPDSSYFDYSCDCGCGVPDPMCASAEVEYCNYCPPGSCSTYNCSEVLPDDNAHCEDDPPPEWDCPRINYGDQACDCGCGAVDVDCADATVGSCTFCDAPGGCSNSACPGTINPTDNSTCTQ